MGMGDFNTEAQRHGGTEGGERMGMGFLDRINRIGVAVRRGRGVPVVASVPSVPG